MHICVYDTNEDEICRIANVPAKTELEACQMVAEKLGYRWIGDPNDQGLYYAVDPQRVWNPKSLEADIELTLKGRIFEWHGLIELYEVQPPVEWDKLGCNT